MSFAGKMITCPNCGNQNPDHARFCMHCGKALPKTCPNCGTANPVEARFCLNCGHNLLAEASPPGGSSQAARPRPETQSPLPTPALEGERRIVTMLFCDVTGSTAAAGQLDPEEWHEIINGAFERMIAPVYRFGGTLARLMGDAILAFFGAPLAHEDDPQRAILAGLDIVRELKPYWANVEARWNVSADVRVGINTGLVVVGAVGSDLKMEYTAIGDAINIASRMEQTAEPGTVQVTEETYRLTAPLFDWQDLGLQNVKGRAAPLRTFRPLGPKAEPGRLRGIEGLDAPMVGRLSEFERIRTALDRLRAGSGGIIFVTGEAGLGKSRLITEGMRYWSREDPAFGRTPHWIEQRATSYDTSLAYGLVKAQVRTYCGLQEGAQPEEVRRHLTTWSKGLGEETREQVLPSFLRLFGAGGLESGTGTDGEVFKNQFFAAMLAFIEARYRDQPGVIVFDDLHWADPASIEMIGHVLQLADRAQVLFLCALRPERESPGWALKTEAEDRYPHRFGWIQLQPLSPAEGETLVDQLLTVSELPASLRQKIQSRADGNPFFVEEIIRSLIDNEQLRREGDHWVLQKEIDAIEIPDGVHALLAARIDRLAEAPRRVLQLASVIGRSFYLRVLRQIAEAQDTLDTHISDLQRVQMIVEAGRVPELAYIFRHALTQETAYRSILRQQRRVFHRRVGQALEALFPDQLDEHAALLAMHYQQAQDDEKALHYYRLAADAAFSLYANSEAIELYRQGLAILKSRQPAYKDLQHFTNRLGRAYELSGQFEKARHFYEEMESWSQDNSRPEIELAALIGQALLYSTPTELNNVALGKPLVERALALAQKLDDQAAISKIYWIEMHRQRLDGKLQVALQFGQKSLELSEKLGLDEQAAYSLHDIAYVLSEMGRIDESLEAFDRAAAYWRESGNLLMLADNLSGNLLNYWLYGDYDAAIRNSDEALRISRQTLNLWGQSYSQMNVAFSFRDQGLYEDALKRLDLSLALAKESGFPIPLYFCPFQQSLILADLGLYEEGLRIAEQILSDQLKGPFVEVHLLSAMARMYNLMGAGQIKEVVKLLRLEIFDNVPEDHGFILFFGAIQVTVLLKTGELEQALELIDKFILNAETRFVFSLIPELKSFKVQALFALGRLEEAREILGAALEQAKRLNQRRVLWQIYFLHSKLAREQGNEEQAGAWHEKAVRMIHTIAGFVPEDMRETFLNKAEVRAVLEEK